MQTQKELKIGENPRNVIRGLHSHILNQIGIHWLRISVLHLHLPILIRFCDRCFGDSTQDGYGLWSYDSRYSWTNGASLNYDGSVERSKKVHQGKVTLDIPGKALDEIHDLQFFINHLIPFQPVCTRIDIFFDDYQRIISPDELKKIVDKKDFSGFREINIKQRKRGIAGENAMHIIHDELDFGRRGQNGCGKYLRVYDKNLESDGEKNCIRWEIEFTKERAQTVFDILSRTSSIESFVTITGSLIGGAIAFIHRGSKGEKNIGRLLVYDFWKKIIELLGEVSIRVRCKKPDMAGMYRFIYKQVSPTLACLRDTFPNDSDFFTWVLDVLAEGELKMSKRQINLAKANKNSLIYRDGRVVDTRYGVVVH